MEKVLLDVNGDIDRLLEHFKVWEWENRMNKALHEPAYVLNTTARAKSLWKRMQDQGQVPRDEDS